MIELAYEGHIEKLRLVQAGMFAAVIGAGETEPPKPEPADIMAAFRRAAALKE